VFPERIDWKSIRTTRNQTITITYQTPARKGWHMDMRNEDLDLEDGENAPVGINSSEPFPALNQSGLPSPER
jgi:hypothetical protein